MAHVLQSKQTNTNYHWGSEKQNLIIPVQKISLNIILV